METDGNSSPLFQFVTLAKSVKTADRKNKFKECDYLEERPLHPSTFMVSAFQPGSSGRQMFSWLLHLLVDLSQDLIEEDVFDVHGEKLSKRTLFGRTKSQEHALSLE